MKSQQPKPLTINQADAADLIRKIELHEQIMAELIAEAKLHIARQRASTKELANYDEAGALTKHLDLAEPERWAALGRTSIQQGFMYLTRAIAQPEV